VIPRSTALRLMTRAVRVPRIALPFGLQSWSPEAGAIAVLLEAGREELDELAVANQLLSARDLPPATTVIVLGDAARSSSRSGWFSLPRSSVVAVPRGPRCGALLMRGYVGLGAGVDEASGSDLVWGFSSPC
jgi:hypothetical protein